jgi:hypothetical protein
MSVNRKTSLRTASLDSHLHLARLASGIRNIPGRKKQRHSPLSGSRTASRGTRETSAYRLTACRSTWFAYRPGIYAAGRRVRREVIGAAVAEQPRQFQRLRILLPLRRRFEQSDTHPGHKRKGFDGFTPAQWESRGMGIRS